MAKVKKRVTKKDGTFPTDILFEFVKNFPGWTVFCVLCVFGFMVLYGYFYRRKSEKRKRKENDEAVSGIKAAFNTLGQELCNEWNEFNEKCTADLERSKAFLQEMTGTLRSCHESRKTSEEEKVRIKRELKKMEAKICDLRQRIKYKISLESPEDHCSQGEKS